MVPSDIARLAQEVVPGTGPVQLERLGWGLVNETYRAVRDGGRYSLRVASAAGANLGLDHGWESQVLAGAWPAGLCPEVVCVEPTRGVLVARWVDGRMWSAAEACLPANLARVAGLLVRIHALQVPRSTAPGPRMMSPHGWIHLYRAALSRCRRGDPERVTALEPRLPRGFAALDALPSSTPVLCHSDLHILNLIDTGGALIVLDWEYAHLSDPFWDLASWIANNDLAAPAREALLEYYLGRRADHADRARLHVLTWAYDYVCLLWSELYLVIHRGPGCSAVGARADVLAARLAASSVVAQDKIRHNASST